MEDLDDYIYKALNRYFTALRQSGYLSPGKVKNLMAVIFLEKFLNENIGIITDCDINAINEALVCLQGSSCLLPYQIHIGAKDIVFNEHVPFRLTENGYFQNTDLSQEKLVDL